MPAKAQQPLCRLLPDRRVFSAISWRLLLPLPAEASTVGLAMCTRAASSNRRDKFSSLRAAPPCSPARPKPRGRARGLRRRPGATRPPELARPASLCCLKGGSRARPSRCAVFWQHSSAVKHGSLAERVWSGSAVPWCSAVIIGSTGQGGLSSGNESSKRLSANAGSLGADPRTKHAPERHEFLSARALRNKSKTDERLAAGAGSHNQKGFSAKASLAEGQERARFAAEV